MFIFTFLLILNGKKKNWNGMKNTIRFWGFIGFFLMILDPCITFSQPNAGVKWISWLKGSTCSKKFCALARPTPSKNTKSLYWLCKRGQHLPEFHKKSSKKYHFLFRFQGVNMLRILHKVSLWRFSLYTKVFLMEFHCKLHHNRNNPIA